MGAEKLSRSLEIKIIVDPAPQKDGAKSPLHGILTICDDQGLPTGIINAEEVTAFRTSMSALLHPWPWNRLSRITASPMSRKFFGNDKETLSYLMNDSAAGGLD